MAYISFQPSDHFNTVTYTGNGSTNNITGVGFQPDWVWIKERGGVADHFLGDSSRGATKYLLSNATVVEGTNANTLQSFDSDGFTLGSDGFTNNNTDTFVSWNWLANGGTTSSNTDGSITSTVQANSTAGFSIVTYTGNQTNGATVGHGLGTAPQVVIIKERNGTSSWIVKHPSLTDAGYYLILEANNAESTVANVWNDTDPSSTVFTLGDNTSVNENTLNYLAYCFAEKKGYSKFGSYTGNGSSDGTFVYTGFRPAWVLFKRTDTTANWHIYDSTRNTINAVNKILYANLTSAEASATSNNTVDFVSNGIKNRGNGDFNTSGATYIYLAFAEHPLVASNGLPATAR